MNRRVIALGLVMVAAAFSSDGDAAPGRESKLREPSGPLGVVPLPPASSPGVASPALALASLDRRIADLDAEEQQSKRELNELGAKIAEAHTRSLSRGRAFYRLTRAGMLPVG